MDQRVMKEWSQKLLPDPEARYFHKTFEPEPNETHENVKFDIRFPGSGCHMSSTVFIERTMKCQIEIDEPLRDIFSANLGARRPLQNATLRKPKFAFASPGMTLQNNATKIVAQYNSTTNEVLNPNIWMPEYTRLYQKDLKNLVKHSGRAFEKRDPICYRDGIFNFNRISHFLGQPSTYDGFGEDFKYKLNMFPECRNDRRVTYDSVKPNKKVPIQSVLYNYTKASANQIFFKDKLRIFDYLPGPATASRLSYFTQTEDGDIYVDDEGERYFRATNTREFRQYMQDHGGAAEDLTDFANAVQEIWDGRTFIDPSHILDHDSDDPLDTVIDLMKTVFPTQEEYTQVYSRAFFIKEHNDGVRAEEEKADGEILEGEMYDNIYEEAAKPENKVVTEYMTEKDLNGGNPIEVLDPIPEYKWQDSMGWGIDLTAPLCLLTKPPNIPMKLMMVMYTFAYYVNDYLKKAIHKDLSFLRRDKKRLSVLKQTLHFVDVDMEQLRLKYATLITSAAYQKPASASMTDEERALREEAHREADMILDIFRRNGVSNVSHDHIKDFRDRIVHEMRSIINKYGRVLGRAPLAKLMLDNSPDVFGDGSLSNFVFEKKDAAVDGIPVINEDRYSQFMALIGQSTSNPNWISRAAAAVTWDQILDDQLSDHLALTISNSETTIVKFLEPLCVSMMRPSEFVDFGCWGGNSQILPYVKRYNLSMEFPTVDKCRYFELDDLKATDIYVDPITLQSHFPHLSIKSVSSRLLCTFVERSISLPRVVPTINMMVYRLNEEDLEVDLGETKSFFFNQIEIRDNVNQVMVFCKSKEVDQYSLIADRTASLTKVHIKTDISNQNIDLNSREMIDAVTMRCYPQYCPPRGAGGNLLAMPYSEFPRAKEIVSGFNHLFGEIAITQDFAPKIKCDVFMVINYKDTALKIENECIRHIRYLQ